MFLFALRRLGRTSPLGLAFTAYQLWRRLSPQQKQAVGRRAQQVARRIGNRRRDTPTAPIPPPARTP
jgi:hypothetical protein